MAKSETSKSTKAVKSKESGSIIIGADVEQLGLLLEQIRGCADLLESHLSASGSYDADVGAQTCINVLRKLSAEADGIVGANYCSLPDEVLRVREANVKARAVGMAERERRDAEHAKLIESSRAKIQRVLG